MRSFWPRVILSRALARGPLFVAPFPIKSPQVNIEELITREFHRGRGPFRALHCAFLGTRGFLGYEGWGLSPWASRLLMNFRTRRGLASSGVIAEGRVAVSCSMQDLSVSSRSARRFPRTSKPLVQCTATHVRS